jgi:hypothetical protein
MATATAIVKRTSEEVKVMGLTDLREYGTSLGLSAISRTSKAVLQQMILDKIEEIVEPVIEEEIVSEAPEAIVESMEEVIETPQKKGLANRVKRDVEVFINEHHRAILDNAKLSKSEKMRRLWKKDMSIADIHRIIGAHYSFTYGVIDRYRKILSSEK